ETEPFRNSDLDFPQLFSGQPAETMHQSRSWYGRNPLRVERARSKKAYLPCAFESRAAYRCRVRDDCKESAVGVTRRDAEDEARSTFPSMPKSTSQASRLYGK